VAAIITLVAVKIVREDLLVYELREVGQRNHFFLTTVAATAFYIGLF